MLKNTAMNMLYMFFEVQVHTFMLNIYLQVEFWIKWYVYVQSYAFSTLKNIAKCFSKVVRQIYS